MDCDGFELFPRKVAPIELQRSIRAVLEAFGLKDKVPRCNRTIVWVEDAISPGTNLAAAHAWWTTSYFPQVQVPDAFPSQTLDAICPVGCIRLGVECIQRMSGGMGSTYGFEGYFISLLIDLHQRVVWDARGELAR